MSAGPGLPSVHILSIIHSNAFGGPHNQALALASSIPGLCLTVVVPDEPGDGASRLRAAGVDVVEMPLLRPRASLRNQGIAELAAKYPGQIRALGALIDDRDIDVVEVHGLMNLDGAIAARLRGCGVVWQLIDTRPPPALRWVMMPWVIALSDVIMTTGMSLAQGYPGARIRPDRLRPFVPPVLAPTGVGPGRLAVRARLGVRPDEALVVGVGNLNPQKGFDRLIEALDWSPENAKMTPRPALRIRGALQSGHETYASQLAELASDRGFGTNAVGRFEPGLTVADLLDAADVFALTSTGRSEGIPTVVLEAMTHGLAVVATKVGAIAEVLTDGRSGHLVEQHDTAALRGHLVDLVADPVRRHLMGSIASQEALALSSPQRFASVMTQSWVLAAETALRRRKSHTPKARSAK